MTRFEGMVMLMADGVKRLDVRETPVEPLTSDEEAILAELRGLSPAKIARKIAAERRAVLKGSGWENLPGDRKPKPKVLTGNVAGGRWCTRLR